MEVNDNLSIHYKSILFRDKETSFLSRIFENKYSYQYYPLFIYGLKATGKSLILSHLIQKFSLKHVWINCHEYCTPQLIFSKISSVISETDNEPKKLRHISEFIAFLKRTLKSSSETTYLIFDCTEILRSDPVLIPKLMSIQNLTQVNICPIFVSEYFWNEYLINAPTEPIVIEFVNYSKSEMHEILCTDCPTDFSRNIYNGYINVIMRTFYSITTNLLELRHLAKVNFEKYCEPLDNEPDIEIGPLRLWKNIEPTLKEALRCVYLREISGVKWKTYCHSEDNANKLLSNKATSSFTRELPFYSKFLLLAAYFASYNPPKSDFKHFVKNQGKQSKKKITKKMEKNRHLLGPKPFSLDRLLSIFFSIVGERVLPSALIFSQISSLVHMRLMSRVSADEQLDCPKYKCLADLDIVCKIGKTVNIDVLGYLDDFL